MVASSRRCRARQLRLYRFGLREVTVRGYAGERLRIEESVAAGSPR